MKWWHFGHINELPPCPLSCIFLSLSIFLQYYNIFNLLFIVLKIGMSSFGKFNSISNSLKWEVFFLMLCFCTQLSPPVPILCLLEPDTVQISNNQLCKTVRDKGYLLEPLLFFLLGFLIYIISMAGFCCWFGVLFQKTKGRSKFHTEKHEYFF